MNKRSRTSSNPVHSVAFGKFMPWCQFLVHDFDLYICILDFFVIGSMVVNNAMDPHFIGHILRALNDLIGMTK